jgi:hypothetical protein
MYKWQEGKSKSYIDWGRRPGTTSLSSLSGDSHIDRSSPLSFSLAQCHIHHNNASCGCSHTVKSVGTISVG